MKTTAASTTKLPTIAATDYMFASPGFRQANRLAALSNATATKAGTRIIRYSPAYPIKNIRLFFPNYYVVEGSAPNETAANTYQIEAAAITVTVGGVTTTYAASIPSPLTVDPNTSGGIMVEIPTASIPAGTAMTISYASAFAAQTALPAYPRARTGEVSRAHDSSSFANAVNSGASLGISGSVSTNWGGFLLAPVYITAQGTDGRPVAIDCGDSIAYGKGQYDNIEPQSVTGLIANGMNESVNSPQIMMGSTAVSGSAPDEFVNSSSAFSRRFALLVLNGNRPFNIIIGDHGNNTDYTNLANFKTLMKSYVGRWKTAWPNVPFAQTTMLVKATSTDGFRTLANQVVNPVDASSGNRFLWNDYLMSTKMDGVVDFVINTWQGIAYDTAANRDHIKIAPFTATLTRAYSSGNTLYVSAQPSLGAALVLDPTSNNAQAMIVTGVAVITAGSEYQLTMSAGSSSSSLPSKAVGTTIAEMYFADGQPQSSAVHMSARADDLITQAAWVPFKNSLMAA